LDRTGIEVFEQVGVDATEERDRLVVPAPPQVVRQLLKRLQTLGQVRQHGEGTNRTSWHCRSSSFRTADTFSVPESSHLPGSKGGRARAAVRAWAREKGRVPAAKSSQNAHLA